MNQDDEMPEDGGNAKRSSPERKLLFWAAIVFGTNMLCLLMLGARAAAPAEMHGFFDVVIFALLIGSSSFAVIRVMFLYPFRLLDLLVMVIALSAGMKGAIEAARAVRRSQWGWLFTHPTASNLVHAPENPVYILYAEACMVAACVMMGGAALGLRHCRLLNIESPVKRGAVLVFGMAALPAALGLVLIPLHLLSTLLGENRPAPDALGWIAALIFSFVATLANAALAIKTIALTTQNSVPAGKWRD